MSQCAHKFSLFLSLGWLLLCPYSKALAPEQEGKDHRLARLERFFGRYDSPAEAFSGTFLEAADRNGLDWRLLPSIALIESGGGKAYRNNNILGWGNGDIAFDSIEECIQTVAERLAESPYYRNKDIDQILYTYNPIDGYRHKVKRVMRRIAGRPARRAS